jgi:6-phosphogluconate dehydrogenase
MTLHLGMVGLGRMGANMAKRLARGGVAVVGFDPDATARAAFAAVDGCQSVDSLEELVHALPTMRIVWLMVPAGRQTEATLAELAPRLHAEDVIVDGGNAFYKDSVRRAVELASYGVRFIDCGVSGGVWGLENGYALMFGGSPAAAREIEPFARILAPAPDRGWLHCGPSGSGHFVKMIHNGIEYGMMQAMAEGLALLKGKDGFELDVAAIAEMWRHGSVVRSWLLDLTADFLRDDAELTDVAPIVADSGEGRWTALEAIEQGVPAPVLSLALMMRFASQDKGEYANRLLSMMRKGFGGHNVEHLGVEHPADAGAAKGHGLT